MDPGLFGRAEAHATARGLSVRGAAHIGAFGKGGRTGPVALLPARSALARVSGGTPTRPGSLRRRLRKSIARQRLSAVRAVETEVPLKFRSALSLKRILRSESSDDAVTLQDFCLKGGDPSRQICRLGCISHPDSACILSMLRLQPFCLAAFMHSPHSISTGEEGNLNSNLDPWSADQTYAPSNVLSAPKIGHLLPIKSTHHILSAELPKLAVPPEEFREISI